MLLEMKGSQGVVLESMTALTWSAVCSVHISMLPREMGVVRREAPREALVPDSW